MKFSTKVLGVVLVLGGIGGTLAGLAGKGAPGDVASSVQQRAVRLPGLCPVVGPAQEAAKCDHVDQQEGWCLCWTKQEAGTVDGEVTSVVGQPAKYRSRLVACTTKDKQGKNVCETRWEKSDAAVSLSCTVAASDVLIPGLSANGLELGNTEALLRASTGCPVTAGHWGHAPCCLRTDVPGYEGGCAAACPPVEVHP